MMLEFPAEETDALLARLETGYEPRDEPAAGVDISDLHLPARGGPVPVRVYRTRSEEKRPIVLWLHGGGFIGGSFADLDWPCTRLAEQADVVLVSLNYRLAPQHPFPAALHDTCDAIAWLVEHGELLGGNGVLMAGGQSAGGNLVAAACLIKRDAGEPSVARQILCYPLLDFNQDTESARRYNGVFHSIRDEERYLGGLPINQYAAPLRAESLANLPPALVIAAERDPLRDDAKMYADRLEHATFVEYGGTMHAILNFCEDLSAGPHLVGLIAEELRRAG